MHVLGKAKPRGGQNFLKKAAQKTYFCAANGLFFTSVPDDQYSAADEQHRQDQDSAVAEKFLRQNVDYRIITGIEEPVILTGKENGMENGGVVSVVDTEEEDTQVQIHLRIHKKGFYSLTGLEE